MRAQDTPTSTLLASPSTSSSSTLCSQVHNFFQSVEFLEQVQCPEETLYQSCVRVNAANPQCLSCLDYVIATTEYEEFYQLMLDHKVILSLPSQGMTQWDYPAAGKDPAFDSLLSLPWKK